MKEYSDCATTRCRIEWYREKIDEARKRNNALYGLDRPSATEEHNRLYPQRSALSRLGGTTPADGDLQRQVTAEERRMLDSQRLRMYIMSPGMDIKPVPLGYPGISGAVEARKRKGRPRQNACLKCKSIFYAPTRLENPVCSECLRLDAPPDLDSQIDAILSDLGRRGKAIEESDERLDRNFRRMLWFSAMVPGVLIAIQFWHWIFA